MKADSKYISYLDGLRGYAILLVLLGHYYVLKMAFAQFGVTLFFFVSGFLITKLLIYEYDKYHKVHLKEFYLRRVFRLYPALIFMIVLYSAAIVLNGYKLIVGDVVSGLFYYTNYYLIYVKPVIPDEKYLLMSRVLWSLSVEEHFYLLFPLLFMFLFPKKRLVTLIVALLPIFIIVRSLSGRDFLPIYATTHCRADSILYGCLSALLIYGHASKWYIQLLNNRKTLYLGVAVLVFALLFRNKFFQNNLAFTFQGLGLTLFIPSFLFGNADSIFKRIIDNKVIVYIGKLSYSLYLFHWVAMQMIVFYYPEKSLNWYLLVVPLSFLLAIASYYFVEKPFVALRRKFGSHAK